MAMEKIGKGGKLGFGGTNLLTLLGLGGISLWFIFAGGIATIFAIRKMPIWGWVLLFVGFLMIRKMK